jgi:O-antigen ligase
MRYEGFEVPIQFFQNDKAIWQDGTGHHFHSWYVDRLYYFGIVGLIFTGIPMLYLIYRVYRKHEFSFDQLVICSFALTGLSYATSYDWPLFFYGMIGIAIAYIDREDEEPAAEQGLEEEGNVWKDQEEVERAR